MVSRFTLFTVLAAAASTAFGQLRIETPLNVAACRPVQFLFSGGTPPYFLTAHPAGQPAAPATIDFGEVETSPFRWTPNVPVGTSLFLRLQDNNGERAESGSFDILTSSDISCIGQEPSGDSTAPPAATDSSAAAPPGVSTTPPVATTGAPASSGASRPPSSASSSSARPSGSQAAQDDDGAALSTFVSSGTIGLAAIAGAAAILL